MNQQADIIKKVMIVGAITAVFGIFTALDYFVFRSPPDESRQPFNSQTSPTPTSTAVNPLNYGDDCQIDQECGNLVGIDCNSAADGPYLYVNKNTEIIVEYCGGYCMGNDPEVCQNCPPLEWNCQ